MAHVNTLLGAAGNRLQQDGLQLLLLIDNMDRYEPKAIDDLLVQSADRFKALACHLIVTPPISLVLRPESQALEAVFRCEIMPTVRLREKGQGYREFSGPGRDSLLEALGKRIDIDRLIPDLGVRDRLVAASGGAIRELLQLAQDVTLEADGDVFAMDDVEPGFPFCLPRMAPYTPEGPPSARNSCRRTFVQLQRPSPQPALTCDRLAPLLSGHFSDTAPHVCRFFARRASLHSARASACRRR